MKIYEKEVWVIMSKDRKIIAKGVPRSRALVEVSNLKDNKRILTYNSKKLAESGFNNSWFNTQYNTSEKRYEEEDLEAVKCKITIYEGDVSK